MSTSSRSRWGGLAAMLGGLLGIVYFPFHATSYFTTADGAEQLGNPWIAAWSEAFRSLVGSLLTFAPPDEVYTTYGKVSLFVVLGFLAGLFALHRWQAAHASSLEHWGFRIALVGNVLMIMGILGEYYVEALEFSFLFISLPGVLLYMIGITLFGIGTLRAQTAPRLGAWLLILGGFPGLLVLTVILGHFSGGILLLDIAWIVLGYALWLVGSQPVGTTAEAHQRKTH